MNNDEKQPQPRPLIYECMINIMKEIEPVAKDMMNTQQKFLYRSIDALYNELHPILVAQKVFMTFKVLNVLTSERETKSGGSMRTIQATIEYSFIAPDGSHVEVTTVGFGEDAGDKAMNKALSNAQKYVLIQTFLVPTGDEMSDSKDLKTGMPTQSSYPSGKDFKKPPFIGKTCVTPPVPETTPEHPTPIEKVEITEEQRITKELIKKGWLPEKIEEAVDGEIKSLHGMIDEISALLIIAKREGLEMPAAEDLNLKDAPKTYLIKKAFEKRKKDGSPYYSVVIQELDANNAPIGAEFNMSIWDLKDEFKKVPFVPVKIQAIITSTQNGQYTNYNYDKVPGIVMVP